MRRSEFLVISFSLIVIVSYVFLSDTASRCPPSLRRSPEPPAAVTVDVVGLIVDIWHTTVALADPTYTPGHWGITSTELYGMKRVAFVVEQVNLATSNGLAVEHICEIGIMAGASSVVLMALAPRAKWHGFDLANERHDRTLWAGDALVSARGRTKAEFIPGDSKTTLPAFHEKNPGVFCDLVLVDAGKGRASRLTDMENARMMSHARTVVIMDEIASLGCVTNAGACRGDWADTSLAYREMSAAGRLRVYACESPFPRPDDGMCVGNFLWG